MKTKQLYLMAGLIAALGSLPAPRATAQTFTVLHSFTAMDPTTSTNRDGAFPYARLLLSGSTLYGTARDGGISGNGTVFRVNTDGSGFATLHNFTASGVSDGANPSAGLALSGNTLYGTSPNGGISGDGTVFKLNTDGTGFSTLHRFTGSDGAGPRAVIVDGSTLYGTAQFGGNSGNGTVYRVNTDGTGFTILHPFTATSGSPSTNSDGAAPYRELVLSANTLYGTARDGGNSGNGTVFKLNTDGTGFRTLYSFSATAGLFRPNSDGAKPYDGLVLSGDTLYGTASDGGATGNGTVFKINIDGTGFTVLYHFTAVPDPDNPPYVNSDGATPVAGLILIGNTLYGTTEVGGSLGAGTVFAINTDGNGFTNLHTFTNGDGANPLAGLIFSGNTLYGTASSLFADSINLTDVGTVFSLALPSAIAPQLTVMPSGANLILTWPADATGFTLQSATNLVSRVWNTNSPAPVVINGQNTVTNPITGTMQYFRLGQ